MKLLNIIAILITLSAAFGYVHSRFVRLPTTIGIMLVSILVSLGVVILGRFCWGSASRSTGSRSSGALISTRP